jgi:hypothetical protein
VNAEPIMVFVEGSPPEVRERARDAVAALKAADVLTDQNPLCPIAVGAALAAAREAEDALALLDEFHTKPLEEAA